MGFSRRLRPCAPASRHWRPLPRQVKNVARPAAGGGGPSAVCSERGFKSSAMSEPEATSAGDAPPDATAAPVFDPSVIRGLQVFAAAGETPAEGADEAAEAARKAALVQALSARAARLAEAVDDALTLANDGAIRWLGDPVGKLIAGAGLLEPRAALLADEALPPEGRELAERRLSLWLAAHVRKALGPLIALAEAEGAPEAARSVGLKVSQALGVLERERVKVEVKALDQEARGVLRKLGVRFGAHYIYVPALLKPGARTLCAQLWALAEPNVDQDAAERLLHFAASGRTSFAVDPPAAADLCRIAGFRLCGDRAVRVDIVERLSDLIRAALPRAPTQGPVDEAEGFVVSGQMTSLTGCSGEPFASILRSLGFVAHPVKKSDHLAAIARRVAALAAATAPARPAEAVAPSLPAEGEASPAAEPAAADVAGPALEPPAVAEPAVEPAIEPAPAAAVVLAAEPSPPAEPPAEPIAAEEAEEAAAPPADETPAETAASEPAEVEAIAAAAPSIDAPPAEAATNEPAAAEAIPAAPAPSSDATPEEAAPVEDEMIEVWRPAPRRPRHQHRHPHHQGRHGGPLPQAAEAPGEARDRHPEEHGRKPWRERRAAGDDGIRPPDAGEPRAEAPPNEDRRGPPAWRREANAKGGRRDDRREEEGKRPDKGKPRPQQTEPRKPSVNLDSPFAKLLDLKPLLQARDKKR